MRKNLVDIHLHGSLGKGVGRDHWRLGVKTVSEACRAIDMLSQRRLTKHLIKYHQSDASGVKYKILINEEEFMSEETPCVEKPETIYNSELCMERQNLKRIDIVPVVEGAGKWLGALLIIVGVLLIITALPFAGAGLSGTITSGFLAGSSVSTVMMGGFALLLGGVALLSMQPPTFDDHTEIDISKGAGGARSYLFSGPTNTNREGGPVPVGYGRLIVGSQMIQANTYTRDIAANKATALAHNEQIAQDFSDGTPTLIYGDVYGASAIF